MNKPIISPVALRIALQIHIESSLRQATVAGEPVAADTARKLLAVLTQAVYQRFHQGNRASVRPDSDREVNEAFTDALARAVPHRYTLRFAPSVAAVGEARVVELDGVRVRVGESDLLRRDGSVWLRLPAIRRFASPGYLCVEGSRGGVQAAPHLLRIYLHLAEADSAPQVWRDMLEVLEEAHTAYLAKVLCAPELYPRHDALVVYLGADPVPPLRGLIARFSSGGLVGHATSAFTRSIVPGVSYAWEPIDHRPGYRGLSFGEHRARTIVDAVAANASAMARDNGHDGLPDQLATFLRRANVDPRRLYRNPDSPALSDQEIREKNETVFVRE